jgi:glycosyltransferase involved in cell wall biosynthesis
MSTATTTLPMNILLVTDAWLPQVHGVVTTLVELVRQLQSMGHSATVIQPGQFSTRPCPGHPGIDLALFPGRRLTQLIDEARPDAIHIATEGPLGWAARAHCRRRGWAFTTAFHTRFPEILAQALHLPERWGYAAFRRFHAPSAGVMVPSHGMLQILRGHGFERLRAWSHGVDLDLFEPRPGADLGLPRPVFLYVGRVSVEKNLEAFLSLDLPGSRLVCGVGPRLEALRRAYPGVHWRGIVPRTELAALYAGADVFVFPGRSETFGLVMLEAMACGTPVAAFPVAGPLDVVGDSDGGVLDEDLRAAALRALQVPRERARARALAFDWSAVCAQFVGHLVPAHGGVAWPVTKTSQKVHKLLS